MTDTHPDLIDLNSGDEYVWTDKGYANTEDTDETAWSRADLERDGASLAAVDTLSAARLARLRDWATADCDCSLDERECFDHVDCSSCDGGDTMTDCPTSESRGYISEYLDAHGRMIAA